MPDRDVRYPCQGCHGRFTLRQDGKIRWHKGDTYTNGKRQPCAGAGRSPARPARPVETIQTGGVL